MTDMQEPQEQYIVALRERAAVCERDPSPYNISILDAAIKVTEAHAVLLDHEEQIERRARQAKRAARRGKLPDKYRAFRGEKPFEHGFADPGGRRYGFWVARSLMCDAAWEHLEDPAEFENPGDDLGDPAESEAMISAISDAVASLDAANAGSDDVAVRSAVIEALVRLRQVL